MESKKPLLAVILIQVILAGMVILSKAAFNVGMNSYIFTFYRFVFAVVCLAPFGLYYEWKTAPSMSAKTFWIIFVMSFFGFTLTMNLFMIGLVYTSASLQAAITQGIPVSTFILAVLFRFEAWKIKTIPGITKLIGMILCFGGATILTLYKGPSINFFKHHHLFDEHARHSRAGYNSYSRTRWIIGCVILLIGNFCKGVSYVMQAQIMKTYPPKLLLVTLCCFLSSIQSFIIAIAVERRPSEWILGWDIRLAAAAYSGILYTGLAFYLQAYVIEKKGPVYLAVWSPLNLVITTICSPFLLGEVITVGSILGEFFLVGGLYSVLWAKNKEKKIKCQSADTTSDSKMESQTADTTLELKMENENDRVIQ